VLLLGAWHSSLLVGLYRSAAITGCLGGRAGVLIAMLCAVGY
jgi:hypothetical protein